MRKKQKDAHNIYYYSGQFSHNKTNNQMRQPKFIWIFFSLNHDIRIWNLTILVKGLEKVLLPMAPRPKVPEIFVTNSDKRNLNFSREPHTNTASNETTAVQDIKLFKNLDLFKICRLSDFSVT